MKNFNNLRQQYKEFIYKSYEIKETETSIIIKYKFEIPNLNTFEPKIEILKKDINFKSIDSDIVRNIVFNLGMVESISYWKCACPENIVVECGNLNEEQIKWFKKLYYLGLGEFRYINNIKIEQDKMINIKCNNNETFAITEDLNEIDGTIIPVGGGKDSTVTLELLKSSKNNNNYCLMIGGKEPSIQSAKMAGYNENQIIEIKRTIDENLLELNKQGYLNGHTPFSAMLAFLSYLVAYLTGKKYIALSNESSANETNVDGENINHQYSKTFEFEQDFREYANKYLKAKAEYFSMLRPINELQIAMLFSENKKYHKIFKSCNVGSKSLPWKWCCNCPKCLFVYIILSPFLYKDELIEIFGEDLFEKEELLNTFIELCGYGKTKPFECVGTFSEVNFAITKTIENLNGELPYLLKYYRDNYGACSLAVDLTKEYNKNNNLPKEFDEILRGKIYGETNNK